jgi:uncharacterized protein YjiS (DUF1127 family)
MLSMRTGTGYANLGGRSTVLGGRAIELRAWLARALEMIQTWQERARQRRQLQGLGDHMLKDLGLHRADVEAEVSKPFWRL